MGLRATLTLAHDALSKAGVEHALIGGIGLATLGIHRATEDVDMLVFGDDRTRAEEALSSTGFVLRFSTAEVLHFEGKGRLDLLLANRPLSREMLVRALVFAPHGIKCVSPEGMIGLKIQAYTNDRKRELQDKADIQSLMEKFPGLDRNQVRAYAELFGEWETIRSLGEWK